MSGKNARPKDWKEARRKRALELKELAWKQCEIAEAIGVSRAAVCQWVAHTRGHGAKSWRAKPRPRGPVKLTPEQFDRIPELARKHTVSLAMSGRAPEWSPSSATNGGCRTTKHMSLGY